MLFKQIKELKFQNSAWELETSNLTCSSCLKKLGLQFYRKMFL